MSYQIEMCRVISARKYYGVRSYLHFLSLLYLGVFDLDFLLSCFVFEVFNGK